MIIADKITKLRKQLGWSQEELAEHLNVSRQSVSKWESAQSIPDLSKIVGLAELFSVSTDFLLKDSAETAEYIDSPVKSELRQISLEQCLDYMKAKRAIAFITVKGTALCVCSLVPLFFLLALRSNGQAGLTDQTAAAIGIILLLVMVAIGASFFIRIKQFEPRTTSFENTAFQLAYGVHGALIKRRDEFTPTYNLKLSIGVALFILSAVPLLASAILFGHEFLVLLTLALMLMIVASGLTLVIPLTAESEALTLLINEGDLMSSKSEHEQNAHKLGAFYWPFTVAIYLAWSLWSMNWGVTWIVWPVAAVAFAGFVGLMGLLSSKH
ncbi:MAG: helix-turn-helix domain-containing protein [Acidiferrobacterales bacterium]|nr:helix-turn-helix domain-containing protein [Acidiferrobacterales bacterium]